MGFLSNGLFGMAKAAENLGRDCRRIADTQPSLSRELRDMLLKHETALRSMTEDLKKLALRAKKLEDEVET